MEPAYTISSPGAFGSGELKMLAKNQLNHKPMSSLNIVFFGADVTFFFFFGSFSLGFGMSAKISVSSANKSSSFVIAFFFLVFAGAGLEIISAS